MQQTRIGTSNPKTTLESKFASVPLIPKFAQERAARSCELRNRDTSAETLRKRKRAAAAMSGRPDRRDIHGAAAERDVERVSAEQVDQGDEDEQERRLPARLGADQVRLSEHGDEH